MCRMSSKEKMNVQDQSKERGVSEGLELSEEKESSPGKLAAVWIKTHHESHVNDYRVKRRWFSFLRKLHCVQSR